jgi:hypothetical protein
MAKSLKKDKRDSSIIEQPLNLGLMRRRLFEEKICMSKQQGNTNYQYYGIRFSSSLPASRTLNRFPTAGFRFPMTLTSE